MSSRGRSRITPIASANTACSTARATCASCSACWKKKASTISSRTRKPSTRWCWPIPSLGTRRRRLRVDSLHAKGAQGRRRGRTFLGHEGAQGALSRPPHGAERLRPDANATETASVRSRDVGGSGDGLRIRALRLSRRAVSPEEAQQEAEVRTQVGGVDHTSIEVEGNTMGLGVGNLVSLRPGPDGAESVPFWGEEDFAKQYLVVGASYSLSIDQHETGDVASSDEPFKARYQLLDSHTQFRPVRVTRKPRMPGRQTALVVGPGGRGDLDRQARARDGAVRLGPTRRAQREVVVLAACGARMGRGQVGRAAPPARRTRSNRGIPRRRSGSTHHHRRSLQQRQHAALRSASQPNPERHQEPQQQGRHGQQLQRTPLRRQEGPRRAAPAGREGHVDAGQARPDPARGREPRHRRRQRRNQLGEE
jgi:hypothetical protein